MRTLYRTALQILATSMAFAGASMAEGWHRIASADGKASVLFPVPLDPSKVRTMEDRTPAGKTTTRVLTYQDDGKLFTISSTQLPGLAVRLAGEEKVLKKSKEKLLAKAYSEEVSYEQYTGTDVAKVMVLKYDSANYEKEGHPGFTGVAAMFVVDKKLYVINSMLTKGQDEEKKAANLAAQKKLLRSVKITP